MKKPLKSVERAVLSGWKGGCRVAGLPGGRDAGLPPSRCSGGEPEKEYPWQKKPGCHSRFARMANRKEEPPIRKGRDAEASPVIVF